MKKQSKPKYKTHLSPSAFKGLQECSARQIAYDLGEFEKEDSKAMLVGKYVDSYFAGTLEKFKAETPQLFTNKGELYAEFKHAEDIIKVIEKDKLLHKYVKGEVLQYEIEGEIGGAKFKGVFDSLYHNKLIADLKIIEDLYKRFWSDRDKMFVLWFEHWGYDRQMAIYQELYFQQTGVRVPVFLAAITKQKPPDKAIIQIPNERMELLIDEVKEKAKGLLEIRMGKKPAVRCEKCEYCRSTKMLRETITVFDLM